MADVGCLSTAALSGLKPSRSYTSLYSMGMVVRAAPSFLRLPGWDSPPRGASPLLKPRIPVGKLTHLVLTHPEILTGLLGSVGAQARPRGHMAAPEGRLRARQRPARSAGWTSALYGLVGGSGGTKVLEFGYGGIQSEEL